MGALSPAGVVQLATSAAAMTIFAFFVLLVAITRRRKARRAMAFSVMSSFTEKDASPSLVTDGDGGVTSMNAAARARFDSQAGLSLAGLLRDTFANPGGITYRLKLTADAEGSAREDIVTRKGQIRLAVHVMGPDAYLWRIEAIPDEATSKGHEEPGLAMLMVGRTGAILFMNDGARALIGHRAKTLDRVFPAGLPAPGDVALLSTQTGTLRCAVSDIDGGAGRRALYLLPVEQPEPPDAPVDTWAAFERLPVPLVLVTPEGMVQGCNRSATALVGESMAKGAHLSSFMEGLGRPIADWLAETIAGRAVQHSEFLRLKRADKEMFVQVTLNRVTENGVASVIAVLTDATELKTLEAQFVQSQKMQAIGQLAGGIAHDFNNLLTAISGHCDLLLLRHDHGDADYGDLVQINQNANRAAALVGQLLAFSRKQTLRPEMLDMRDTLSDLTHLLNRLVGEKVTLTLSHDPMLQAIRADKRQLEQVLMNLVVNARDAMPDGGEIRIETECVTLNEPMTRDRVTVPGGQYVAVRVVDRGIGIAPDKLQKVFEPFFTTKSTGEGTGLGLSTAYGIVKQTGGFIFVDSTEGEGTCFTLLFPVLEGAPLPVERAVALAAPASPSHGDGVILLVEDEAPVRAFASRALRLRGYTVLEADCAESALKTLEDADLNVDLFVTDVVMPGKDGPSWVREALKSRPEVRVVFVSGYAEDRLNNDQASIPNSVFLPKPFSLDQLTETVHKQLH
ncbi:ATP-binding protein [Pseudosulfitobacter koreensis]|nr:ATP-binding protein [Pseudosulfitobacter koreense]